MLIPIFLSSAFCLAGTLIDTSEVGFSNIQLRPNKSITVSLQDRSLVILNSNPGSFGFSFKQTPTDEPSRINSYPSDSILFTGHEVEIKSTSETDSVLPVWLIPKDMCNSTASIISAEHHLSLRSSIKKFNGIVCLFSQPKFHTSTVDIAMKSKDTKAATSFYSDKGETPIKVCKKGKKCHITSHKPFFIQIKSAPAKPIKLKMEYSIKGHSDTVYCQINSIPKMFNRKLDAVVQMLGDSHVKCRSQATDMLKGFKYGAIVCVCGIVVAMVLQISGIVDLGELLCPDAEKKRFDNLKRDPFASRIAEPVPSEVQPAGNENEMTAITVNNGKEAV